MEHTKKPANFKKICRLKNYFLELVVPADFFSFINLRTIG